MANKSAFRDSFVARYSILEWEQLFPSAVLSRSASRPGTKLETRVACPFGMFVWAGGMQVASESFGTEDGSF